MAWVASGESPVVRSAVKAPTLTSVARLPLSPTSFSIDASESSKTVLPSLARLMLPIVALSKKKLESFMAAGALAVSVPASIRPSMLTSLIWARLPSSVWSSSGKARRSTVQPSGVDPATFSKVRSPTSESLPKETSFRMTFSPSASALE